MFMIWVKVRQTGKWFYLQTMPFDALASFMHKLAHEDNRRYCEIHIWSVIEDEIPQFLVIAQDCIK